MPFPTRLGFMSENSQKEFVAKFLPRLPGCRLVAEETPSADSAKPPAEEEANETNLFTHWIRLTVSSPTAARDLCHQLTAFLNHYKQSGVLLEWTGADGTEQNAQISGQMLRDAEIAGMRLSVSVKAHNDVEKAAAKAGDAEAAGS